LKARISSIANLLAKRIVFDRNIGIDDTVFVASVGRSGSTFLANVINHDNSFRVLFEPFRHDMVDEARDFVYPFYIRPDSTNSGYYSSAQKIISGRVRSKWANQENRCVFPKARLIKEIRANFFLKWLQNNFPAMKVVLLLRHPCAVADSWTSAGFGDGRLGRERLLENQQFVADTDGTLINEYVKAETAFERLIFFWCFSYHVPFQQCDYNDAHLVFYENLILDPENELRELFRFLGSDYPEAEIPDSLSNPSSTTRKGKSDFDRKVLRADEWRDRCSKEQSARADEIMKLFGMDTLWCPISSMPNTEAAKGLFGSRSSAE
jgi:hypothetical protein